MTGKEPNDIRERVKRFFREKAGEDVDDNTLIFEDTGIDGIEPELFMTDFFREFSVDPGDFDINNYSQSEYEMGNPFLTLYSAIFDRKKLDKKSFPVSHLYRVVELGRWVDATMP